MVPAQRRVRHRLPKREFYSSPRIMWAIHDTVCEHNHDHAIVSTQRWEEIDFPYSKALTQGNEQLWNYGAVILWAFSGS